MFISIFKKTTFLFLFFVLAFFFQSTPSLAVGGLCDIATDGVGDASALCCTPPAILEAGGGCQTATTGRVWIGTQTNGSCEVPPASCTSGSYNCTTGNCVAPSVTPSSGPTCSNISGVSISSPSVIHIGGNICKPRVSVFQDTITLYKLWFDQILGTLVNIPDIDTCADGEVPAWDDVAETWNCAKGGLWQEVPATTTDIFYEGGNVDVKSSSNTYTFDYDSGTVLPTGVPSCSCDASSGSTECTQPSFTGTSSDTALQCYDEYANNFYLIYTSSVFHIDASNERVGIGTANPVAELDINGDATVSGKVGIGTATPFAKLEVVSDVASSINTFGISVVASNSSTQSIGIQAVASGSPIVTGLQGFVNDSTATTTYGTWSMGANASSANHGIYALGSGGTDAFGVYAIGSGADNSYGVYTTTGPAAGQTGYALYADSGTGVGTRYAGVFMGGNVGIGTTSPVTPLDVRGAVRFGTRPVSETVGISSFAAGHEAKASGFSSISLGTQTEATQNQDIAIGNNTTASGGQSVAIGTWSTASGNYSMAIGYNTAASGSYSIAMGNATEATRTSSTAMGINTKATGIYSTAMGYGTESRSHSSMAVGRFNVVSGQWNSWIDTEPLFVIGNGDDDANRSNAMTVLKNGNVGIGTTTPAYKLDVAGVVNLNKGASGVAMRVNGAEALWYNGTYFSWGYDGINYFANNVGIGTTSPDQKLSVIGNVRAAFDAAETEYVEMRHGGANAYVNWAGDGNLDFRYGGSTKLSLAQDNSLKFTNYTGTGPSHIKLWGTNNYGFGISGSTQNYYSDRYHKFWGDSGDRTTPLVTFDTDNDRVGIGTDAPSKALEVIGDVKISDDGNTSLTLQPTTPNIQKNSELILMGNAGGLNGFYIRFDGTDNRLTFLEKDGSTLFNRMTIDTSGNVIIGTATTPNYKLDVRGTIGNNTTSYHSDVRWKKNIKLLNGASDKIMQLRGVNFEWRVDEFSEMEFEEGVKIGLIAQEVEPVVPEVVDTAKDGYKSVQYSNIVPLLIEGFKEQQKMIEELKTKVEALEIKNN